MEYSATMGRLGLGLLGLEGEALGSCALLAHNHDNQLFFGLGDDEFGPKQLAERSIVLVYTYVDTLSTLLGSLLLLSSHAFTMMGSGVLEVMSIKRFS
jgi:hypothetical protein